MKTQAQAKVLRIYLGALDKYGHRPLYEVIVEKARERGLTGATVLRAIMGFGARKQMHTAKVLRLSEDVPVVVEIVDKPERIEAFLPDIGDILEKGLVTLETVDSIAFRRNNSPSPT